jgi:hypothetical protein
MRIALVLALLAAGCQAQLGATGGGGGGPDAGGGGGGGDGGGGGQGDAAPDAPACFNGRVVYLAFEGVALTQAGTSDATTNQASWIGVSTANVPKYHANDANRMGQIQSITAGVTAHLASFPITVVTQRPTSGPYVMVVFGGTNQDVGSVYTYATSEHDCGDAVKSDVAWLSDVVPDSKVADYAVGAIAWGLGLNGTSDTGDCMCGWANNCQQTGSACTLGTSQPTTSNLACAGQANPQNEVAVFQQAFCQ